MSVEEDRELPLTRRVGRSRSSIRHRSPSPPFRKRCGCSFPRADVPRYALVIVPVNEKVIVLSMVSVVKVPEPL
jgi:hypothetical protein